MAFAMRTDCANRADIGALRLAINFHDNVVAERKMKLCVCVCFKLRDSLNGLAKLKAAHKGA